MFLVIDCGNTNTIFAFYSNLTSELNLINAWRINSCQKRTPDDYFIWLNQVLNLSNIKLTEIEGVSIASVVPEVLLNIKLMIKKYLNVKSIIVGEDNIDLNVKVNIDNPNEAGADRLVNACAVKMLNYDPAIVIDFGTATTFDVIGVNGNYEGGIIAPGINLSIDALYSSTSRLPKITIRTLDNEALTLVGKNTISAMESGVFWGYVCMIEGLISKLKNIYKDSKIIATGGLSKLFKNEIKSIDLIEKNLTISGLAYIYKLNEKNK